MNGYHTQNNGFQFRGVLFTSLAMELDYISVTLTPSGPTIPAPSHSNRKRKQQQETT